MTLKEAQQEVDSWIKKYGVRYFSELTNMAVLTEEVGELARVMARKYGDQSFKEGEKDNVEEEIADVLWVLLCIANQTGVDITEAFARSIEKKTKRDQARHINNPKLSQDLASLRYNPEESRKQTGEVVACQAVYSKMTEEAKNNEYNNKSKTSNELEER